MTVVSSWRQKPAAAVDAIRYGERELMQHPRAMTPDAAYTPPTTISRGDFLRNGTDAHFREIIYAMVESVGRLLSFRDAFGKELQLTPSQFAVLMGVAHCQGHDGVTIGDLAGFVSLASTHATTEVGRLERVGLLVKRPSPTDRRSVLVSLSEMGEREISRVAPLVRLVNDALFRDIQPADFEIVHKVARQLILNYETAMAEVRTHYLRQASAPVD